MDDYTFEINGTGFNLQEELNKVEIPMEEEILLFFVESRTDELKEKATNIYMNELSIINIESLSNLANFDYYDLLRIYEELEEESCSE